MGIPSYFSHILHSYAKIIHNYASIVKDRVRFTRLYMDCNSILYDVYRSTDTSLPVQEFYSSIIQSTAKKIDMYIRQIRPNDVIFIAFDGVAPMAKMDQQRTRRYKSWFEKAVHNAIDPPMTTVENEKTTCIFTPGTVFMNQLSQYMKSHFLNKEHEYCVRSIYVATPDEPGEGEHKLYAHMRENPHQSPEETSAVYGLDADLLMLSLLHLPVCPSLYVFREAPQFGSVTKTLLEDSVKPDEPLFLDIAKMGRSIVSSMKCSTMHDHKRLQDYVFICFFLGNDFLPHFPSMNIRTHGIDVLIEVYRQEIANKNNAYLLASNEHGEPKIQWKQLSRFVKALAKYEQEWLHQEYSVREKWSKRPVQLQRKATPTERIELFTNTPVLNRAVELAINPYEKSWQMRYYQLLFPPNVSILNVCQSYLEGLQWVTQYYTVGKVNWNWTYQYDYPPLLQDLAPKIPHYETEFLPFTQDTHPVHPYTQLCYVLPPVYHFLLPVSIQNYLRMQHSKYYVGPVNEDGLPQLDFQWAFCRYFWECHVHLPNIPIATVQEWERVVTGFN
jgi:5'-3' exonuclease